MANNSNSQNSYLILDSLSSGAKYGLEIIEYISQKTGGNIILKKPSLYSCLTRMEKKGLIYSSYWGESDIGGKRHYYSLTSAGKRELEMLGPEFQNFEFNEKENSPQIEEVAPQENKPIFLQQDNLFDIVKSQPQQTIVEEKEENQNDVIENQIDIFSLPTEEKTLSEEDQNKIEYYENILSSTPEKPDDGKFLEKEEQLTPYQEAQNRKIYDTSSELKKYRKKKSFSENQIEMSVVYEREEDRQIQKARIEQLKASMLSARDNNSVVLKSEETAVEQNQSFSETTLDETNEKVKDDAVFITNPPIDHTQIPVQKKITPPNIDINIYDNDLPAPKRDSSLEPTYKDMMAKLFERKKEKIKEPEIIKTENVKVGAFSDYHTLKSYYASHNIEFKEYNKTTISRNHNTNLLNLVSSCILLLLAGIGCGIFYAIISGCNLLKTSTNFMFYTLPLLFAVYAIYCLVKYKVSISKKPNLTYNSVVNWAVAILATVIIFVINIVCGMQYETMANFLTTLLIPTWGVFLIFPINFYIKLFAYKKFGK